MLLKLARQWWMGDCIRVSPQEGKLWHLQPGSLLEIREESFEVLSRRPSDSPGVVEFECRNDRQQGILRMISISEKPFVRIDWTTTGSPEELPLADVQIWS